VRAGAPQPDISTPDAIKKTLQAARTVAYTNPAAGGTAGIYMTGLLDRLGLTEEIKKKELLEKSGSAVADAVANGAAEIGISFTSELLPNKGRQGGGPDAAIDRAHRHLCGGRRDRQHPGRNPRAPSSPT